MTTPNAVMEEKNKHQVCGFSLTVDHYTEWSLLQ